MLDQIRDNDIIVVWKLDRLARSTRDLLETMEIIRQAGGKFQSLSILQDLEELASSNFSPS